MSEALEDLVVTITVDTSRFDAAIKRAIEAVTAFAPHARRLHALMLQGQRRQVRIVTRRKQRNRW